MLLIARTCPAFIVALLVGYSTGAQTAYAQTSTPAPGRWTGSGTGTSSASTSAQVTVEFQVSGNVITSLSVPWRINTVPGTPQSSYCGGSPSFGNIPIRNGTLSVGGEDQYYAFSMTGTFTSLNSASGTVELVKRNAAAWCLSGTIRWTANALSPVAATDSATVLSLTPPSGSTLAAGGFSSPGGGIATATVRYTLASQDTAFICVLATFSSTTNQPSGSCDPRQVSRGSGTATVRFTVDANVPNLPVTTRALWILMGTTAQFPPPYLLSRYEDTTFTWTAPPQTCPAARVDVDTSLSNGVVNVDVSGSPCERLIRIRNTRNYWTNFRISSIGPVSLEPVGGNSNLFALTGLLPPSGFIVESPLDITYIARPRGSSAVSLFVDPTAETSTWGPTMNVVQILIAAIPGSNSFPSPGAILWSPQALQTVQNAFQQMPHLQAFTKAVFGENGGDAAQGVLELIEFLLAPREWAVFLKMIEDLGVSIGAEVILDLVSYWLRIAFLIAETAVKLYEGFDPGSVMIRLD